MIPAIIINDIPLPNPCNVIWSAIHIRSAVPAVRINEYNI